MRIPDAPGLGLELNEAALAAHPFEPRELRHYAGTLTDIRPPDETGYAAAEVMPDREPPL